MKKKKKLIILIGGSATGKTTTEFLMKQREDSDSIVSHTSREPREGEIDGVSYHFSTVEEMFKIKQANLIKITDDWYYSVSENELKKDFDYLIYSVINIQFAEDLIKFIKRNKMNIVPFIVFFNISQEKRFEILKERGSDEEDIKIRFSREDTLKDFERFSIKPDYVEFRMDENMQGRIMEAAYGSSNYKG